MRIPRAPCWALLGCAVLANPAFPQSPGMTIERLLSEGWEIRGYIAAWENRSLILFKHHDRRYLVQCSVLIDVMRAQRVVTACYELR
jgi:hypothetical protein